MGNAASKQTDEENGRNCICCNEVKRVSSGEELEPGDHIVFQGTLYEQHAIITAKEGNTFTLVEATNSATGASIGTLSGGGKALIQSSTKQLDFENERISVVIYKTRLSKEETIDSAEKAFVSREWRKDYRYHFFQNNSEHFARYCITGHKCNMQVANLMIKLFYDMWRSDIFVRILTDKELDEFLVFQIFKKKNMICDDCYRLSFDLVNPIAMPIRNGADVNTGDVIRYYKITDKLHDAVVLEVHSRSNLKVSCTIMHYAFNRFLIRTIKKDRITIELNGKYCKLDYTSKFDVYSPDEVVRRANERENEKSYERLFNDSRCFARWCKIKQGKASTQTNDCSEENGRNCICCLEMNPVSSGEELDEGDHIVFHKPLYEHHAIITAKEGNSFTLVEATNSATGASTGSLSGGGKALIQSSTKQLDFQNERISVVIYKTRLRKEKTVERAKNAFVSREWTEDYRYHFFQNNCEHFARYCTTGHKCSMQVTTVKLKLLYYLWRSYIYATILTDAELDEFLLFQFFKKNNMICEDCYRLSFDLVNPIAMPIRNGADVNTGDVIRYNKIPDKLHDAVILEVHSRSNLKVSCTIMHYALHRSFSRTIKKDRITIELNGKYCKLDYTSKFDVYSPDEVVRRAIKRENEQSYERVFNDSRCFARWCKIKQRKS
uniref:Uncharacterized protein LOC111101719 isoform X2 n=1 Tax=Crassostrea virginica TaxID=6565 RepID=A0A8B8AFR0_CRAVI|nr:uncharacterized protein LOC111101719 isoform X2 [Crassostrea virginica]